MSIGDKVRHYTGLWCCAGEVIDIQGELMGNRIIVVKRHGEESQWLECVLLESE